MDNKNPRIFIEHIDGAIKSIYSYLENVSEDYFLENPEKQDAVIRRFEIIGEASRNLSEEFKLIYDQIPWRDLNDLRNVLIHEYFDVDLELIWKVVHNELKVLQEKVILLLDQL